MQRLPLCGGRWNNGSNAGVFNVNLNNPRSNSNSNVGFRSALPSWSDVINPRVYIQYRRVKDAVSVAIAKKNYSAQAESIDIEKSAVLYRKLICRLEMFFQISVPLKHCYKQKGTSEKGEDMEKRN